MDGIDFAILRVLRKQARASLSEIGQKVNLSVSAVGERIKKLEASGVISRYVAIIDGSSFHKELTAFMFVSLENPSYIESFLKFIDGENDILECHYIAGNYDYVLKIVTNNPSTLEKLLNKIKGVSGVIKTYTNVVLATCKNNESVYPE
ncbi:MAG TPA: Lrp/AsnC family transcriptional regulator [Oscillospiraceae bacterium]|nr:Lrp/AsnC family transcriptional regulator [Oscillospiraceae bacterium]HPF56390.1 Lrp/AsnC family transcriptional regulator [Clostridiales bacterium]HPK35104.1 Lrp/AsnC family transcriptional regulator [Oscillospiraceae bacterium]HPR75255.1 Lrp/AsnC family transcriptional regulator [Oscillospiraceae bacterium]